MNRDSQRCHANVNRRRLVLGGVAVLSAGLQAACTHGPSKLLTEVPAVVRAIRIWSFSGNDPAMLGGGVQRIKETLIRNGLAVPSWIELSQAWSATAPLETAWKSFPSSTDLHHALVFTHLGRGVAHNMQFNRYEVVLWDAKKRALIWQGKLGSATNVYGIDVQRRSDRIAGDTLRSLKRDGLWAKDDALEPLNMQGEVIAASVFPMGTIF
jgi:hypothetical protein